MMPTHNTLPIPPHAVLALSLPTPIEPQNVEALWHNAGAHPASEAECLSLIDNLFVSRTPHTPQGRGDDCAELILPSNKLVLSTDFFWQHSHFRTSYFTPQEVGAKALTVAISDLAAAGAVPLGFSLGLMVPSWVSTATLTHILEGMAHVAHTYNITLTGGDLSKADTLGFCCTVWGSSANTEHPHFFARQNAQPNDIIFLAGNAGLARIGLALLEHEGRSAITKYPHAVAAHLAPTPRFDASTALTTIANNAPQWPHVSLMDLSDGIAQDLPRLLGSYGANLTFAPSLIHPEITSFAQQHGHNPEELFILGGEDFALLGTCPPHLWPALQQHVPNCHALGTVTLCSGLMRNGTLFTCKGFDHFTVANK